MSEQENENQNEKPKTIFDLTIKDIDGIGPTTEKKLKSVGILTVPDLAVCSPTELSVRADIANKETAAKYIMAAQDLIKKTRFQEPEFTSATKGLEIREKMQRLTTGSTELDKLLKGGIETQAITEFFGEYGSSKSQICHTLCVNVGQPVEKGGLDGSTIYLDTEGTFRVERLKEIAQSLGYDDEQVKKMLDNTQYLIIIDTKTLEDTIENIGKYIQQFNAKLVIVDSVIALHRAEYLGRGTLAERQQKIAEMLFKLKRVAQIYNIAIVITNQVMHDPSVLFNGNPTKPVGGNVLGHTSTYRIYLVKGSKGTRIATMIDSPYHPYGSCRFLVNEKGVTDIEDDKDKKKEKEKEEK